jgi:hypothetical protein
VGRALPTRFSKIQTLRAGQQKVLECQSQYNLRVVQGCSPVECSPLAADLLVKCPVKCPVVELR